MRNKLTDELAVCGYNAVAALGKYHPERINRLFLKEDRLKQFTGVCKDLAERKRPYKICEDEELERICKSAHHQGIVAMMLEPEIESLTREELDAWALEGKTGLLLYSLGNDHNLGAIARSAAFFDAPYIVINGRDSEARLSTSACRIAEGGMEHVSVRKVEDAAAFLRDASRRLVVIGADNRARQRIRDLPLIVREQAAGLADGPGGGSGGRAGIILVLGNEETGLPREVKDRCPVLVRIPGTGLMESLNVAQAATLFLHELFEL
jgi:TrmH RNA methyltransferase